MSRIAIYGGSFNPIHVAHIELVKRFICEAELDYVYLIPTNITPLKDNSSVIKASHRLNMCRIAAFNCENILVSDIEIQRKGMSYTSDTIAYFKLKNPTDDLYLIMGADMFLTLDKWHNAEYIFKNAAILTVPRDDVTYEMLYDRYRTYIDKYSCRAIISKTPIMDISSTGIREKIKSGADVADCLDSGVLSYIIENNLYR